MGFPIRTPAGQRLLAPLRGFSQLAASFVAGRCQGILHARSSAWSLIAPSARADAIGFPRNRMRSAVHGYRMRAMNSYHARFLASFRTAGARMAFLLLLRS